jgi:Tol biopolymer transport system component
MNANGSGRMRLAGTEGFEGDPAWSPDGTKLAFESDRDGNFEIYVVNADGSGKTRLTQNDAGDGFPAWGAGGS